MEDPHDEEIKNTKKKKTNNEQLDLTEEDVKN